MLDKFRQQHLVWDFANEQVYEAIISSSGDSNGRTLAVTVYDAGTVSDLTGTELYLAWQRKDADFAGEDQFAAKDITKGEYELTYSAEMISHAGKTLEASFRIKIGANTIIESRPFEIIVMRSVYNEAAEKSGEFSSLQAALVRLATIEADEGTRQANERDRIDLYELVEQKLGDGDFDGADGVGLQYDWSGTQLGIKREDESTYDYTDLKGDKGDTGDVWKPSVTSEGDLSWTKDSGATAPTTRNIKGDTGDTWKPSVSESGYLTWAKDSSGTTPTARDIKGPKGDTGDKGETGDVEGLTSTHIATALGYTPLDENRVKTDVPEDAKFTDTVYSHPTTHPASMITESSTKRFVSDTKISEWDGKETTTGSQDKANQAEQNAKDYTDQEISSIDIPDSTWESIQNKPDTFAPSEHVHSIGSVTGLQNELNSKETPSGAQSKADVAESNAKDYVDDKVKTDVPVGAKFTDTVYSHPPTHPASMITDLPTGKRVARFVVGTSTSGWTASDCDYLCDGTADDVEINAAITALPAAGGEIVILDGTYNITATIDVTKDNVSIVGNGNATILKRMFNSSVAEGVITLTGRSGCKIANLQVDGNRGSYTNYNNYGISLSSSSDNTVTGNTCNNNSNYGIFLSSSSDNTVTGNTYNNNSNYGISLSSSSDNTVTGNTCNNNSYGISLSSSSDNTVTGNTCSSNGNGIYLGSSSNNTITGNTCIRGTGLATDYTESQHTIRLGGTANSYNLISNNNCMGKAPVVDGGTGNSVYGNKYDFGDYKDFTQDEKIKLAGISDEANKYTHPDSHPASMITESSTKRFVSDSEKSTWNSKSDTDTVTTINGKTGAISKADITALGIPAQDTNTTYDEITTAEIDTGTDSTLRTITGRRVKYILDKVQGWIGNLTKSDVGLSNVDNVKQMPISGGVLENYREKLTTVSASGGSIDLSLGNVFVHSPSGNRTYSITNAVAGQAHSFTLIINMGSTVRTLTFPASVKWQGGEIPDMTTANKTYVLTFMTVDGGATWLGMFGGEF